MIEQIQFAKLFGVARIDNLLQEMLLGGDTQSKNYCCVFNLTVIPNSSYPHQEYAPSCYSPYPLTEYQKYKQHYGYYEGRFNGN